MKTSSKLSSKITAAVLLAGCLVGWSARADVEQIWAMNCAACHGKDGKGSTMMGRKLSIKDMTDAKTQSSFTDAEAAKSIKEGVTQSGTQVMKGFGDKLSDADVTALVAKVRSFK
jgi:mono/diheme cytochrome c family protein